jgi:predicted PhzF superfamily epimerase YddE/YHI9
MGGPIAKGAEYYIVDAFTSEAFRGNPAAVVVLTGERDSDWMQKVAAEMNLSDTAFVDESADGEGMRSLRWFTPTAEVDLCGHATLATARVLGGDQRFRTHSGVLQCHVRDDNIIEMDFPADPVVALPQEIRGDLQAALPGVEIAFAGRGVFDTLVVVTSAEDVRRLHPNMAAMLQLDTRGVIVTAPSDDTDVDFVSRCFLPSIGINEDPVTGSAHCTLASWWSDHLGRDELVGRQVSKREGVVHVRLSGDRVHLVGNAVIVAKGRLLY